MLELRAACERCDKNLPPDSREAHIGSQLLSKSETMLGLILVRAGTRPSQPGVPAPSTGSRYCSGNNGAPNKVPR
jgi:hypothetical protein